MKQYNLYFFLFVPEKKNRIEKPNSQTQGYRIYRQFVSCTERVGPVVAHSPADRMIRSSNPTMT